MRIPEPRVVTLSPSSTKFFESLKITDHMEMACVTPFDDMVVYEQVGQSYIHFNSKTHRNQSRAVRAQEKFMKNMMDTQEKLGFERN